jgi:hypothetical protein
MITNPNLLNSTSGSLNGVSTDKNLDFAACEGVQGVAFPFSESTFQKTDFMSGFEKIY